MTNQAKRAASEEATRLINIAETMREHLGPSASTEKIIRAGIGAETFLPKANVDAIITAVMGR